MNIPVSDSYIYLASASPRRRELLQRLGVDHEVLRQRSRGPRGPDFCEDALAGEKPRDYVLRVCRDKAESGYKRIAERRLAPRALLAADTTVCIGDQIFGTPADTAEAARTLARLSGREHEVLTAVALKSGERIELALSVTAVRFCALEPAEIERYVASGEPMDKAGAYGIQGYAGAFVAEIRGSYSGVMGLPLYETAQLLKRFGVPRPA